MPFTLRLLGFASLSLLLFGCPSEPSSTPDAGPIDAASPMDAGPIDAASADDAGSIDAAPAVDGGGRMDGGLPPSTAHCRYEPLMPTARAGGANVSVGPLSAGASERLISIPIGVTLGAYTARALTAGAEGFYDQRRDALAGVFATSVGVELWPRVRAVALTVGAFDDTSPAGQETILLIKADIGASYQGLTHALEERLGAEFAGKVVFATNHSHAGFANFTGHSALQIGFGAFRRTAFEALLDDMEAVAREALARRVPARIGFFHDPAFDPADTITRDRRGENNDLAGGPRDDRDLYLIRLDESGGAQRPIAMIPIFGIHGTVLDADNVMVSADAPGGIERVLEDEFDHEVVIMHLQGAAGDVSPVGIEGATECGDREFCDDFARVESVGWNARDVLLAAWTSAGTSMVDQIDAEMVTRSVVKGPDPASFSVRSGALSYSPWDGVTLPDGVVWEDPATRRMLRSPIDEFNAPFGAALCAGGIPLPISGIQIPGANRPELADTPYPECMRLNGSVRFFENLFTGIPLGELPLCDTTRTTVSAARIGEYVFMMLPGEPVTLFADRLRDLSPHPDDREIVVGYAQDHGGYLLTAEDWMRGGYEPSITFWGPLEGEAVLEQVAALVPLVLTPEREEATAGGTSRVSVPMVDDGVSPDAEPAAGYGPIDTAPGYLLTRTYTREDPNVPPPQPSAIQRLQATSFTFIGNDPLLGTPTVTLEREVSPGTWETARRRSGRVASDGHILLFWTSSPLPQELYPRDAGGLPRPEVIHYWTAEWQAVAWTEDRTMPGLEPLADRAGAPLGSYRFKVRLGTGEEFYSNAFQVSPAALTVTGGLSGTTLSIDVSYRAQTGYRLIDRTGATRRVPLRGQTVNVSVDGGPEQPVALDGNGQGTLTVSMGTSAVVTDRFGNTGTLAL